MKSLVLLLFFLFTFSALAKDFSRGGELLDKNIFFESCSLKSSQLQLIATLSDTIDKRHNEVPGSITRQDSDNAFPSVGMVNLAGDRASHGSGALVGLKGENGKIMRNKVVTSAHNLFVSKKDEDGILYLTKELKVPIEALEFLLGYDVNDEDHAFKIKKIECAELHKDQCILTLDRDAPKTIKPLTLAKTNPSIDVNNADYLFFVGYPSWVPSQKNGKKIMGRKGERVYSQCKEAERYNNGSGDMFSVKCNAYAGGSGGAFIASRQRSDGSWEDTYVGLVGGIAENGAPNLADTFRYNDLKSFNSIVVTSENQRQFFASN